MSVDGMNYDNMLIRILNRFGDALILSLMFILGCIPIFTIGASVTATYYAAMKGIKGDDGYVFKNYIKSFKQNFKQSTVIWLIIALLLFVFGVDLWFWLRQWQDARVGIARPMIVISVVLLAVTIFIAMYVFPLQAKFDNKVSIQIRNAFLLAVKNFPITLLLLLFTVVIAWMFYYRLAMAVVGFTLFGFGFCAYGYSYFMLMCFKPYLEMASADEAKDEAEEVEDDKKESEEKVIAKDKVCEEKSEENKTEEELEEEENIEKKTDDSEEMKEESEE